MARPNSKCESIVLYVVYGSMFVGGLGAVQVARFFPEASGWVHLGIAVITFVPGALAGGYVAHLVIAYSYWLIQKMRK